MWLGNQMDAEVASSSELKGLKIQNLTLPTLSLFFPILSQTNPDLQNGSYFSSENMMEIKDPAIKLFGKTIPLAGDGQDSPRDSNSSSYSSPHLDYVDKEVAEEETMDNESDEKDENESSNDAKNSQQKTLKKPDKILPCPRCNSMDTKFCYYNNYNVNQPRHFCKSCQRYWTAGGTMRNVPVGSGRRKNKTSPCCNLTIHPELKSNGTLLTFGSDDPSSGSTVTTTSSIEKAPQQEPVNQNGFFPNQIPCFQWPTYMWNSPFCPSAFPMPMPFYPPPPYWNIHWAPPTCPPTLGKHSRDGEDPTVLVPKTLRIDDPDEAAKSSIWTTLGINKEKGDSKGKGGGFFNSIHFKDQKREGSSAAFKANPAALCRSDTFQENNR